MNDLISYIRINILATEPCPWVSCAARSRGILGAAHACISRTFMKMMRGSNKVIQDQEVVRERARVGVMIPSCDK